MHRPARAADRFFERRTSVMTRALRSPNTPWSIARGRKPGNRHASARRIGFDEPDIEISCQVSTVLKSAESQPPRAFQAGRSLKSTHTFQRRPSNFLFDAES